MSSLKRFFRKLLNGCHSVPRVIITDRWASYGAAQREIRPGVEHRQPQGLNNRAENAHQPTRQTEQQMRCFKSARHAQRFLSAFEPIRGHFRLRRHKRPAMECRAQRMERFLSWNEGARGQMVA